MIFDHSDEKALPDIQTVDLHLAAVMTLADMGRWLNNPSLAYKATRYLCKLVREMERRGALGEGWGFDESEAV